MGNMHTRYPSPEAEMKLTLHANCGCGVHFTLCNPRHTVPFMKTVVAHSKNFHHSMEFHGSIVKGEKPVPTVVSTVVH
jgi:hypothetical protein